MSFVCLATHVVFLFYFSNSLQEAHPVWQQQSKQSICLLPNGLRFLSYYYCCLLLFLFLRFAFSWFTRRWCEVFAFLCLLLSIPRVRIRSFIRKGVSQHFRQRTRCHTGRTMCQQSRSTLPGIHQATCIHQVMFNPLAV